MKMGVFLKSLPFHFSLTTKGFTTQDIKGILTKKPKLNSMYIEDIFSQYHTQKGKATIINVLNNLFHFKDR